MAPIIVQKFGGTSLSDPDRLEKCAQRVATMAQDHRLVIVVSAMGGTTDWLLNLAQEITDEPDTRSLDMLLSTGEIVSTSLMSIALRAKGIKAIPMTGAEAGITTDELHGKARIRSIQSTKLLDLLEDGMVPVVAGFQGATEFGQITTIGRGGSDTSAVAIAASLDVGSTGGRCEIYTDVDGVYTSDPRMVPSARRLHKIGVDEMLELASVGAGVLQERAVVFARRYNVPLKVLHSYHEGPGTLVLPENPEMERNPVVGCALREELGRISLTGIPKGSETQARIFLGMAEAGIFVDDIVQTEDQERVSVAFTVEHGDLAEARDVARTQLDSLGLANAEVNVEIGLAKISAVGAGMRSHVGIAGHMFDALNKAQVPILNITTSEIRISCLIPHDRGGDGLRAIHKAFGLEHDPADGPRAIQEAE